jgi:hypothetical protein
MTKSTLNDLNIFDLVQSAYSVRVLYILTKIGVFESLYAGPKTLEELGDACNAGQNILEDFLKFAVALRYIRTTDGQYRLAKKGLLLTQRSGSWFRPYLLVWGAQLDPAFAHLEGYLRTGENAFKLAHGDTIWDYYRREPEQDKVFVEFMQGVTHHGHLASILEEMSIGSAGSLVDVAGGTGNLACALAAKYETLSCVVCDQPGNTAAAYKNIASRGVGNCTFVGANIFDSIPSASDLYTIKHVLHDWDDDNVVRILATIANAMRADSRLIIIEGLLDRDFPEGMDNPEYIHTRNLEQRAWTPGRVRSSSAFAALCARAGLRITAIKHSNSVSDLSYIECGKVANS